LKIVRHREFAAEADRPSSVPVVRIEGIIR